jgi:5-methylcytosine-specific restriction endonuclease McrA
MRESHKDRIRIREELWEKQNKICVYCKSVISYEQASLDHIIPVILLEENIGQDNLVVCCKACNKSKGKHIVFTNLLDKEIYPMVHIPRIFRLKYIVKERKKK